MRFLAALLVASALLLGAPSARAHSEDVVAQVVLLALLPSIGPEARFRSDAWVDKRFVFAWPVQVPLDGPPSWRSRHRLVLAPEFVTFSDADDGGNEDTFLRFRAGYRYVARGIVIFGLGTTFDVESAVSLSPELGVRTPHYGSFFAITRVEASIVEDDPMRVNFLVGLSFY